MSERQKQYVMLAMVLREIQHQRFMSIRLAQVPWWERLGRAFMLRPSQPRFALRYSDSKTATNVDWWKL